MEKIEFFIALLLSLVLSLNYITHGQDYGGGDGGSSNGTADNSTGNGTEPETTTEAPEYPTECPMDKFTSQQDFDDCCAAMDANRRNFSDCCTYPQLVVWTWQYNACIKKVQAQGQQPSRCNVMPCCYDYMNVTDKSVTKTGIKIGGLKYSFLLSVNNNTLWVPPINNSVETCNKYLRKPVPSKKDAAVYKAFWDCFEKIPLYLYDIIGCSYDFNYVWCPSKLFNSTLDRCNMTRQYVYNCLIGGV